MELLQPHSPGDDMAEFLLPFARRSLLPVLPPTRINSNAGRLFSLG
jgi:hypothetical protein